MMGTGRPLSHVELLTIANKDEQYYRDWIGDPSQTLAQKILGVRKWMKFRNAITVLSRLGYFASIITPGEEYCDALPTKRDFFQRLATILLNNELQLPTEIPKFYAQLLKDVHLITFFLFGDFFELAKRVTSLTYLTHDSNIYQSGRIGIVYKVLGCMSLVKLLLTISQHQTEANTQEDIPKVDKDIKPVRICQLCSETRVEPTSTLCGHIFCWTCIHKWLKERTECPICRAPTEPSRLIHLLNFR